MIFLLLRLKYDKLRHQMEFISSDNEKLKSENLEFSDSRNKLIQENASLKAQIGFNDQNVERLKENFQHERALLENARKEAIENSETLRLESERQWQLKFDKLKEELQNLTTKILTEKQAMLQQDNKQQLGDILKPIEQQFVNFQKIVEESKTSNEVAKKELKDSFESTMKLFAQQQNQAVESLKQETMKIGNDANNLTNALKRDTKKQGNWGELILETLLESSGLQKDVHYFIQETVKDEEGKMYRPDVIVKFPEGRSVIIDSKVSLTAYAEAYETEDEDVRRKRLKDHARSVRKHVEELSGKKYDDIVADTIGFILMFIPNDQCYLTALEEDADISRFAYSKGVVIISPSNLMMALQLAFNMWQQDVRNKNIDNIVKSASDLYDKVAGFSETMENLGKNIRLLNDSFDKAKNQLYDGNGNIFRRVENLKNLGVTPKKAIRGFDKD